MTNDELTKAIAVPEGPIKLNDGRTLLLRSWQPHVDFTSIVTITATFVLKDKAGRYAFAERADDADIQGA